MAKENGLGMTVSVDDAAAALKDISNDINNFTFSTPRGVQDVTGVNGSAIERVLLLADFSCTLNGAGFNDASDHAHPVFRTVPSTSVARTTTIVLSGQTLSNEVLYTDYSINRAADGSITWAAPGVLSGGVVPTWS